VIFLDAGFLFGLVSTKDEHHDRVVEASLPSRAPGSPTSS